MWNNNGYPAQGSFQQGPGNFQQGYEDNGYIPFSPLNQGQQYISQQGQYFGADYNSPAPASQHSTPGEYTPEINFYNDGAYLHNQFSNADSLEQHVPQRPATAGTGNTRPALTARAEELKAKLLKGKERARSGTPPVQSSFSTSKSSRPTEGPMLFRGSPNTSLSTSDGPAASRRTSGVMDEDLDDLISEAKAAANEKSENRQNASTITRSNEPTTVELRIKSQAPTANTATRSSKDDRGGKNAQENAVLNMLSRPEANADLSDTSEGEIRETDRMDTSPDYANTNEAKDTPKRNGEVEVPKNKPRPEEDGRAKKSYGNQERRQTDIRSTSQVKSARAYTERREEGDRIDRKGDQSENNHDQKRRPEASHRPTEAKPKSQTEDATSYKSEVPTLAQLLLVNEDLKDWLDVTGYHNEEYRQKILNRRRALAALDAQKAKLLEEIEIEERGGVSTKTSSVGMLPPPVPSKISTAATASAKKEGSVLKSVDPNVSKKADQEMGTKRSYTDYHKSHEQTGNEKADRPEERTPYKGQGVGFKTKADSPAEARRPTSRGHGPPRRRSQSPRRRSPSPRRRSPSPRRRSLSADHRASRHDDIGSSRKSRSPDRGYKSSHQLKRSPSHESHESKRTRIHDYPSPNSYQDRGDYKGRPFVQVGNYRGRAYDPFYRGRGRGRGNWHDAREQQFEQYPPQQSTQHDNSIAAMKPYLDPKPLDLGGRGGGYRKPALQKQTKSALANQVVDEVAARTYLLRLIALLLALLQPFLPLSTFQDKSSDRYFIVKSFNEENIVRCVEDSIWTTQVENGDIFKAAFHKCRNVILVFSANQSRAFQGYARMENTPGSEKAPTWQGNIHWKSAGAFKVKWICVANTHFNRVGHLKNRLNENLAVLVGRDGQEIEEQTGAELLNLINEEAERLLDRRLKARVPTLWDK